MTMRELDYEEIYNLADDIGEVAWRLKHGSRWANDADLRDLFVKLALELDYVVKHVPRPDARCAYTVDMGI
jgi:hypothetical protein